MVAKLLVPAKMRARIAPSKPFRETLPQIVDRFDRLNERLLCALDDVVDEVPPLPLADGIDRQDVSPRPT